MCATWSGGCAAALGFTAVVVAVLGLGIGGSTAVFSLVYGVVLAPLPFRDPAQLVTVQIHIREMEDRFPAFPASLRALEAWARPGRVTCARFGGPGRGAGRGPP